MDQHIWRHYAELRPDELAGQVKTTPTAYWPLGLLEHHGWHLPVGFDGIKAERLCERLAQRTGGVVLPVMWWGGVGGHEHYPWESIAGKQLDSLQARYPQALILWGTEATIGRPDLYLPGDHAAREETSYGLSLLPELVYVPALTSGRDNSAWPYATPVAPDKRYPGVRYDPDDPLFAQMGEDARAASAERGEAAITRLVELLAQRILAH